jgi:hypothetical protein
MDIKSSATQAPEVTISERNESGMNFVISSGDERSITFTGNQMSLESWTARFESCEEIEMKKGITKAELVEKLAELLRMTRLDIKDLELRDEDTVIIHYECESEKAVDITADSGIAIIRDVCRHVID